MLCGGNSDPRRRQLDRQRQPVQPVADLGDRRRVLVGDREIGLYRLARSMNKATASYCVNRASAGSRVGSGSASGGTAYSVSPDSATLPGW